MKKYTFSSIAIFAIASMALAGNHYFNQELWQQGNDKKSSIPHKDIQLKLHNSPAKEANVTKNIQLGEGFGVQQGDWVKVIDSNGKIIGWAETQSVSSYLEQAYQAGYHVQINGNNQEYTVTMRSPKETQQLIQKQKKRWKKQQKMMMERLSRFNALFQDPWEDMDKDDDVEAMQKKIQVLEKEVATLRKK